MEHVLLGMLPAVTQKSFCNQIKRENTELTEITSVACFFSPTKHYKLETLPFDPATLYLEECLWNLCSVGHALRNTAILLLLCS